MRIDMKQRRIQPFLVVTLLVALVAAVFLDRTHIIDNPWGGNSVWDILFPPTFRYKMAVIGIAMLIYFGFFFIRKWILSRKQVR